MKTDLQSRKFLSEYQPPAFSIISTRLRFELDSEKTIVTSELDISRTLTGRGQPLRLDGCDLTLISVSIDGRILSSDEYMLEEEYLSFEVPDSCVVSTVVEINPAANTKLEGLYLSNGVFCTQCEAEGFRYITYYLDRPDVMSRFSVRIEGSTTDQPLLLSNGNLVSEGKDGENHWAEWQDPFPKPSYLFALVAGDLATIEDQFITRSGKQVALKIYTEHHNSEKCDHAMRTHCKKRWNGMRNVFGLEYDLDLYMVVAVDDFNMGAMENKGLNVFNTKYVLANPQSATDDDYQGIESVIAHEYFHNWTGNRVTCRDWFQLSLKEGLTVFRDQQFSADMASASIQRINDVRGLRNHQFPEDAGPMAHPIRPASYQEINNFYTATVYEKGAEVVRMIHSLLGIENFRKGMDLYFKRHDGQAVTTDDFRAAMSDASGVDLEQFQRWYEQSGTPLVKITREFDKATSVLKLIVKQFPGKTKNIANKPFHIPMRLSLLSESSGELPLNNQGDRELLIDIKELEQTFEYKNIPEKPLLSTFRHFTAPVVMESDLSDEELSRLMVVDTDPFNRWDAGQQIATRVLLAMVSSDPSKWQEICADLIDSYGALVCDENIDAALCAEMLVLPGEKYLAEMINKVDVHQVREARQWLRNSIAISFENLLRDRFDSLNETLRDGQLSGGDTISNRRLKNICLGYLLTLEKAEYFDRCSNQFAIADNMTDQIACLANIVSYPGQVCNQIVQSFYEQWQDTTLVTDKWFSAQGSSYAKDSLDTIVQLFNHPAYSLTNPNRARSLLGALIGNSMAFHQRDGAGYRFVSEKIIELDSINPQVAARMANSFVHWRKLKTDQGLLMRSSIESMLAKDNLSNDLHELLSTCLEEANAD